RSLLPVSRRRSMRSSTCSRRYAAISVSNAVPAFLALARFLDIVPPVREHVFGGGVDGLAFGGVEGRRPVAGFACGVVAELAVPAPVDVVFHAASLFRRARRSS